MSARVFLRDYNPDEVKFTAQIYTGSETVVIDAATDTKKYCVNCVYFQNEINTFESRLIDKNIHEMCVAPENFNENYYGQQNSFKSTPSIINRFNNCQWYASKYNVVGLRFYYSDIIYSPMIYTFVSSAQNEQLSLTITDNTNVTVKWRYYFRSENEFLFNKDTVLSNIFDISSITNVNCDAQLSFEVKLVKNSTYFDIGESSESIELTDPSFTVIEDTINNLITTTSVIGSLGDYLELSAIFNLVPIEDSSYSLNIVCDLSSSKLEVYNVETEEETDVSSSCDQPIEFYEF